MSDQELSYALAVKKKHERALMRKRNVVGVGVGFRQRAGHDTDQVCIVVSVSQKKRLAELDPRDVIPRVLENVPVDVQETGPFRAF
ncbi:MAG: hypothetical protein JW850_10610 [Thermoflexales bacterium]|nr:hypothetical protein [Thermoflexales bacterium]